jgi:histidine phosphotransferase ChpT
MSAPVDLRVLELLCARLCHELIGPVAAIGNGAELIGDDDPDFVRNAGALVAASARQAAARLQFYRFAYGFGPDGGLTGPAPDQLAAGLLQGTRIEFAYRDGLRALPLDRQKLACNLVVLGAEALPRGGRLAAGADRAGPYVDGSGAAAGLSAAARAAVALAVPVGELTSRTVQPYFTGLLARNLGCRVVEAPADEGGFRLAVAAG